MSVAWSLLTAGVKSLGLKGDPALLFKKGSSHLSRSILNTGVSPPSSRWLDGNYLQIFLEIIKF